MPIARGRASRGGAGTPSGRAGHLGRHGRRGFPATRPGVDRPTAFPGNAPMAAAGRGRPSPTGTSATPPIKSPSFRSAASASPAISPGVARLDRLSGPAPSCGALGGGYVRLPRSPVDAPVAMSHTMPLEGLFGEPLRGLPPYPRVRLASARVFVIARFQDPHRFAGLPDGAEPIRMPSEGPEPHARSRLEKARKLLGIPFLRSSSPAFFLGSMISWPSLISGLPLPGKATSPVSPCSRAHRLGAGSLIPSSSESPRAVASPERTTFAAAILNCPSQRFLFWVISNTSRT